MIYDSCRVADATLTYVLVNIDTKMSLQLTNASVLARDIIT